MKPGDLLASKYRLEHVLGSGGMGQVWAAVNETTGRPVAIKLMHSPTSELRARMLREARAGGTLKHRNIVDIYDVGETEDGDPFLVMERLSGETLDERLKRGSLPPAKAVEITISIAAALKVAHAKGIVHRDLKPANVFLRCDAESEGESVKVLDFGVSKHLLETTSTITAGLVGSPAYMSPEQARAEPNIDARSDLWSLGVVLFEMLSGRRPFPSDSPYVVITEVVTGTIPRIAEVVPGLSPILVSVVDRCLTRDVDARVRSADELIRRLDTLNEEPTRIREMPSFSDLTVPLPPAPVEEHAAIIPVSNRSGLGPAPRRGPSNVIVAVVACASALLLLVVFGMVLREASPAATGAASASTELLHDGAAVDVGRPKPQAPAEPPKATNSVASSTSRPVAPVTTTAPAVPPPVATTTPETPASSEPATPPRPGGHVPPRTHPSGEKRLVLP